MLIAHVAAEASTSFGSQQEGDGDTLEHQAEHQDGDLDSKNADVEKAGAQFESMQKIICCTLFPLITTSR